MEIVSQSEERGVSIRRFRKTSPSRARDRIGFKNGSDHRGAAGGGSRDHYGILSCRAGFRSKGQDRSDKAVLDLRSGSRRNPVA